jgi:hypothetical protein
MFFYYIDEAKKSYFGESVCKEALPNILYNIKILL